jgi:hypothetical protein
MRFPAALDEYPLHIDLHGKKITITGATAMIGTSIHHVLWRQRLPGGGIAVLGRLVHGDLAEAAARL